MTVLWWPPALPSDTAPSKVTTKPRWKSCRMLGMPGRRPNCCDNNSRAWRSAAFSCSLPRLTDPAARPGHPGPNERGCLLAFYFKHFKPRAKILILDAKDTFFEQDLFQDAWNRHYPGMIEWLPGQFTGGVKSIDVKARVIKTAGETFKASVANIIPAQMAGELAQRVGLADQ